LPNPNPNELHADTPQVGFLHMLCGLELTPGR